jgi:hypothetical protein
VVTENPPQHWTPQLVHDELRRIGWPATRSAVQTALQRLAENGNDVRRVRPGTYEAADRTPISKGSANGSGDSQRAFESAMDRPPANANEEWLTAEILQRVADEAAACFLTAHPGESDPGTLVGEATRRVNGWIERHNQEPYDEGHVRRLMKTALSDHYQRTRRNGSRLHHDALQKGGDR